jgi:hypothetical protein
MIKLEICKQCIHRDLFHREDTSIVCEHPDIFVLWEEMKEGDKVPEWCPYELEHAVC